MTDEVQPKVEDSKDQDKLLAKLGEQNEKILRYSRLRFIGTWAWMGLIALLAAIAIWAAVRNAKTDIKQTDDIARVAQETAESADASTEDITAYLRGEQGIPGVPGANGVDGTPGQPSSQPGPRGDKGDTGDAGSTGPPGTAGTAGPTGPTGPQGALGSLGPVGPMGPAGSDASQQGPQGPQGVKGDEGARGAEGPTGPMGAQGPQGPPGAVPPLATSVAVGQSANNPDTPKTAVATCPTGRATGGGYAIVPSDPGLIVTASSPVGNNAWNATVEELSLPADTSWQVLVFAICLT